MKTRPLNILCQQIKIRSGNHLRSRSVVILLRRGRHCGCRHPLLPRRDAPRAPAAAPPPPRRRPQGGQVGGEVGAENAELRPDEPKGRLRTISTCVTSASGVSDRTCSADTPWRRSWPTGRAANGPGRGRPRRGLETGTLRNEKSTRDKWNSFLTNGVRCRHGCRLAQQATRRG